MRMHHQREDLIWGSTLDHSERLVLLCLNSFVDGNGECWPGVERISDMTGLGERTVTRLTTQLASKGILQKRRRRTSTGLTSNKYKIEFDLIPQRPEKEYKKTLERMEATSQNGGNYQPKWRERCSQNGGNVAAKMADDLSTTRTIQLELSSKKEEDMSGFAKPDDLPPLSPEEGKVPEPAPEKQEETVTTSTPRPYQEETSLQNQGAVDKANIPPPDKKSKKEKPDRGYAMRLKKEWFYSVMKPNYPYRLQEGGGKVREMGKVEGKLDHYLQMIPLEAITSGRATDCLRQMTLEKLRQYTRETGCEPVKVKPRGTEWEIYAIPYFPDPCNWFTDRKWMSDYIPGDEEGDRGSRVAVIESLVENIEFLDYLARVALPSQPRYRGIQVTSLTAQIWLNDAKYDPKSFGQLEIYKSAFQQKQQQRSTSITQPIAEPLDYIPESPTPVTAPVSREKIEAQKKLLAQRVASNVRVTARVV